uniref:ATP-dependent DNA helicase n=1 Tax=Tanacetum cinerariifolium TaxID=118510 RepID=A0A6L2P8M5_TANCI|nr:ATP-dependent DNA helicase PIF1-like [Tanacetum cinerariifolium]
MLNKSIFLTSNTNIGQDGKIHSYCGLRLAYLPAAGTGTSSTSKYAHTRVSRRPKGVPIIYHNLGPPSHQCSMCNVTTWYNERSEKSRKAVTLNMCHNLCDVVTRGDTSATGLGKRIVLPRTYVGSPRYMMHNYQDAMALCRTYGNPDLFVTFTSNPKWPEMLAYILGQKSHDRPERPLSMKMDTLFIIVEIIKSPPLKENLPTTIDMWFLTIGPDRATIAIQENVKAGANEECDQIMDEAPMTQIYAFEALDKALQDILGYKNQARRNRIFRGMTVLLEWDFRQILPVITNAKRPEVMGNYQLKKESKDGPTWIKIPEEFVIKSWTSPIKQIVAETYPNFTLRQGDDEYLTERTILTPRNDDADAINEKMFKKLGGAPVTYNNADEICKASTDTSDQHDLYPVKFLNLLNFQGMPPFLLLKKGTPNNAHSEYKPKSWSVQRDETHHH